MQVLQQLHTFITARLGSDKTPYKTVDPLKANQQLGFPLFPAKKSFRCTQKQFEKALKKCQRPEAVKLQQELLNGAPSTRVAVSAVWNRLPTTWLYLEGNKYAFVYNTAEKVVLKLFCSKKGVLPKALKVFDELKCIPCKDGETFLQQISQYLATTPVRQPVAFQDFVNSLGANGQASEPVTNHLDIDTSESDGNDTDDFGDESGDSDTDDFGDESGDSDTDDFGDESDDDDFGEDGDFEEESLDEEEQREIPLTPKEAILHYVAEALKYGVAVGDLQLSSQRIQSDALFMTVLGYKKVPISFKEKRISWAEVPQIIQDKVLPFQRNPFLVILYRAMGLSLEHTPIQTVTSFELIEQLGRWLGKLTWEWEVRQGQDRLDFLCKEARMAFECDENGHLGYNTAAEFLRDTRIVARGYKPVHYNPDAEDMASVAFRIAPLVQRQALIWCFDGDDIPIQDLIRFGLRSTVKEQSPEEAEQESFVLNCGKSVTSECVAKDDKFCYDGNKVKKYLDIEDVQSLISLLMSEKLEEGVDWVRSPLRLTSDSFNLLLMRSDTDSGRRVRRWYLDLRKLLLGVIRDYRVIQKQLNVTSANYAKAIQDNDVLRKESSKKDLIIKRLEATNSEMKLALKIIQDKHGKKFVQKGELQLTTPLKFLLRKNFNAAWMPIAAFKKKLKEYILPLKRVSDVTRLLRQEGLLDSTGKKVINATFV
jgi:hypothetical protein